MKRSALTFVIEVEVEVILEAKAGECLIAKVTVDEVTPDTLLGFLGNYNLHHLHARLRELVQEDQDND